MTDAEVCMILQYFSVWEAFLTEFYCNFTENFG